MKSVSFSLVALALSISAGAYASPAMKLKCEAKKVVNSVVVEKSWFNLSVPSSDSLPPDASGDGLLPCDKVATSVSGLGVEICANADSSLRLTLTTKSGGTETIDHLSPPISVSRTRFDKKTQTDSRLFLNCH